MITSHARDGFDQLLIRSIKGSLVASPEDVCDVAVSHELSSAKNARIVMLTISSYLFRLLVLIHFTPDDATKAYFAKANQLDLSDMNEQSFHDTISEYGNMCCGILNRELGVFFPHIGMSTPNILDKHCASYLRLLGGGHIQHFAVGINGAPLFQVSLCVCDYADLDFMVDANEENSHTGELELF